MCFGAITKSVPNATASGLAAVLKPKRIEQYPQSFSKKERQRDEEVIRREYLAQFTDHIAGWIGFETLEQCVITCTERPPVTDAIYSASVYLAFKGDDSALAIAHRLPDGTIILDYTATWTGNARSPFGLMSASPW